MKLLQKKQSTGAVIVTWVQLVISTACFVLYFFPLFNLFDGDKRYVGRLYQLRMLFGGKFHCGNLTNQTVHVTGSASFLVGLLVPIFLLIILHNRERIRPFFTYIIHGVTSIAFLFYMFSTRSAAAGVVRENSDLLNGYAATNIWTILTVIIFAGLTMSVILVVLDIYRLKRSQQDFEELEADKEDSDEISDEKPGIFSEDDDDDNDNDDYEDYDYDKDDKDDTDNRLNRSVRDSIADKKRVKPVAHVSTEEHRAESVHQFNKEDISVKSEDRINETTPLEKNTVKVKAKIKATPSATNGYTVKKPTVKRPGISVKSAVPARKTAVKKQRSILSNDDFDENSGY